MSEPEDLEFAATDQLIRDVLNQPLAPLLEMKLERSLRTIRTQLVDPGTTMLPRPELQGMWKLVLGCLAATIVLAFIGHHLTTPRVVLHEPPPVNPVAPRPPVPPVRQPPQLHQIAPDRDSALVMDDNPESGYGSMTGRMELGGGAIPAAIPLATQGLKDVGSTPKCGPSILDDSLIVDSGSRGIANVFVFLAKPRPIHPTLENSSSSSVPFYGSCGRFLPHAAIVRTDQVVSCRSLNTFPYNIRTLAVKNAAHNVVVQSEPVTLAVSVQERLPFKVVDDIHPWMSAYWLVLDHPYAAITNFEGRFTIPKLPEGECEFHFWHESAGFLQKSRKVVIESKQKTDLGILTADVSLFVQRTPPMVR